MRLELAAAHHSRVQLLLQLHLDMHLDLLSSQCQVQMLCWLAEVCCVAPLMWLGPGLQVHCLLEHWSCQAPVLLWIPVVEPWLCLGWLACLLTLSMQQHGWMVQEVLLHDWIGYLRTAESDLLTEVAVELTQQAECL